ncbi:MAG TPA: hypothetical protein VL326_31440 [Kofleriaceae bacterium]|nr:hypothetical protein [Kofleriaceae bacterium]
MRRSVVLLGLLSGTTLAACSSQQQSSRKPETHPGTISNTPTRTCKEAALGIESATRGVRDPGNAVAGPLTLRCHEDAWAVDALECFATMREGDLGKCARLLPELSRGKLFAVLGGYGDAHMSIAIAHARLEQLTVGVKECDDFVGKVASVLACERIPLESRVELGQATVDVWALPRTLAAEDAQRMSAVCGESLASLTQQATDAGCNQ